MGEPVTTTKDRKRFCTMADVIEILPTIRWLWPGWLPRGSVTLLVGAPGVGKSMLGLAIARCVVEAREWPDGIPGYRVPNSVVWCDCEWAQAITADRIKNWDLPPERFIIPSYDPLASLRLDMAADKALLEESIKRTMPELLIVDSLNAAHGGDQNSAQDMKRVLQYLGMLARDFDIGVLAIGHLRKRHVQEDARISLERISGNYNVSYYSRVVAALELVEGVLYFSVIKTNYGEPPEPLRVHIEPDDVIFEEAPDLGLSRLDKAIKFLTETLKDGPVRYKDFIRQALSEGISKRQLYKANRVLGIKSTRQGWVLQGEENGYLTVWDCRCERSWPMQIIKCPACKGTREDHPTRSVSS